MTEKSRLEDNMKNGAKVWYFPDGYLPEKADAGKMEAHEALMLMNTSTIEVLVKIDVYFSDRAAVKDIEVLVPSESIKVLRIDHPDDLGGLVIAPLTQYGLRIRGETEIIAQFGRLDTTQINMAYYGCIGYSED